MNYTQAIEELETIVQEIESAEISIDELSEKVKRASELIRFCRKTLNSTEAEVQNILKDLKDAEKGTKEKPE
ncbi:MAG: exodeoxyribonuclease VII small subunit [Bacteroidetes bacterium]|nr:MAG: exodeoxyribonuclease VII small subunit [Bacteroidota bacterium]